MGYRRKVDVNPFNSITSILFLVLIFVGMFFLAKGVFTLLSWLAPVFLILTLVIDYKVVVNYGNWIVKQLKSNPLMGIGAILLTVFGFPVISGFLFVKALLYRKMKKVAADFEQQTGGLGQRAAASDSDFTEYEEVDVDNPFEDLTEKPLDLNAPKDRPTQAEKTTESDYEEFFE